MAETERFESRLAAGLERLADEVPTAVDSERYARAIASAEGRRRWWWGLRGGARTQARDRLPGLVPVLRFALAPAFLLVVAFGVLTLAQRSAPAPYEGTLVGRMTCAGTPWTAGPTTSMTLDCLAGTADPRLDGTVRIALGEPTTMSSVAQRSGSFRVRTDGGSWSGTVTVTTAPNGLAAGDATLRGSGDAAGLVARLHLVSADGVRWGIVGSMEAVP